MYTNTFDYIFKNKILMYLFEDIGRHKRDQIFKKTRTTLSDLFTELDNQNFDFKDMFKMAKNIPTYDGSYIDADSSTKYDEIYVELKGKHYKWNEIRIYINEILSSAGVNEDKQLGFWFISTSVFLQKDSVSPSNNNDQSNNSQENNQNT